MTSQRSILGCTLVAAAAASLLTAPAASAAPLTDPASVSVARPDDFDGDGYRDVVVAAPDAQVGQVRAAGQIAVHYGSASGAVTTRRQTFHQDSPGVPDQAEEGDRFGHALATGDLDRDGYTDLVVSTPLEDYQPQFENQGMLTVVWGGSQGLAGAATVLEGPIREGQNGTLLTAGDYDGDGDTDLALNHSHKDLRILSGPFGRDGSAAASNTFITGGFYQRVSHLATGDINGDGRDDLFSVRRLTDMPQRDTRGTVYWLGAPGGPSGPGTPVLANQETTSFGGDELALGDVDKDGYDDLVIARYDEYTGTEPPPPAALGGKVTWIPGSAQGPKGDLAQHINQDTPGVPGAAEADDAFGSGVAVGDIDGDGYADISAGVPSEELNGTAGTDHGAVVTLRGGPTGPTGTGAQSFNQNTAGVPGAAEAGDAFGRTTALIDTDGDGRSELFAGAPGENVNSGAVWSFDATPSGPTAQGSVSFGPAATGIHPDGAAFGSAFQD